MIQMLHDVKDAPKANLKIAFLPQPPSLTHSEDSTLVPGPALLLLALARPMPLVESQAASSGRPVKLRVFWGSGGRGRGTVQATQALGPTLICTEICHSHDAGNLGR